MKQNPKVRPLFVVLQPLAMISILTVLSGAFGGRGPDFPAPEPFEREAYGPGMYPIATHQVATPPRLAFEKPISEWSDIPSVPNSAIDDETLWLARCIYSETKDTREMELVAWVVRNRVETRYRGRSTYQGVVLDPFQFSAFNQDTRTRPFYMSLTRRSNLLGWRDALNIAYLVKTDDGRRRPFSVTTRHFYSELSMVGRRHPTWTRGFEPVAPNDAFKVDEKRFRFFDGIS